MPAIYKISHIKNGETFNGTAQEIADRLGLIKPTVLAAVANKRRLVRAWNIEKIGEVVYVKTCAYCGKEYETLSERGRHCSDKCRKRHARRNFSVRKSMQPKSMTEFMAAAREAGMNYKQMQQLETVQMLRESGFWGRG